jgi:probable F420-dependent oxidoreductase
MEFWQNICFIEVTQLVEIARYTEHTGYAGIMVSDHVVHPEKTTSHYPYAPGGGVNWESWRPWPDPWVLIGAMSAAASRLRFMTTTYVAPARNPFVIAKAVGTAAVLSDNRVVLGVGAGWFREEFELLGEEFTNRGARLDEIIEILRLLWQGGMVEFHGRHYDFDRVQMSPAPSRPVPIYGAGHSAPALRRAARLDGWIGNAYTPEDAVHYISLLNEQRRMADTLDREDFGIVVALQSNVFDLDVYRRLQDAGVTTILCTPWLLAGGADEATAPPSAPVGRGQHTITYGEYEGPIQKKLDAIEDFAERVIARL